MMIKDPIGTFQKVIESAVTVIREPAGKKYDSKEYIMRNRSQFLKDFHRGLFLLHLRIIQAIIDVEDKMRTYKGLKKRKSTSTKKGFFRIRQIFRCINDSIAWTVLRGLHQDPSVFIRRTCQKQHKGYLKDQNYESAVNTMWHLFAGGDNIPILNDATRCLDIADITLFSPINGISFIELKEGKVNNHIFEIMEKTNHEEFQTELYSFFEKYGQKGIKQIDRIIRQEDRSTKLIELAKNDNVFDPFLGSERIAISPKQPFKTYDHELSSLLEELRSTDYIAHSIDDCLYVVALNKHRVICAEKGREIIKQYIQNKISCSSKFEVDCKDVILSLESSFNYATAMPIMLRHWAKEDIARFCLGQIEIFFGFDVNAWGRHLQSSSLSWSPLSVGRKEFNKAADERLFVVCDRIPQIISPKGETILLGTHFLQIMICEGIRPISLASFYDQIATSYDQI